MRQTRRSLLRRVGTFSAAGTAAVAGCQSLTSGSENQTKEATTDSDATATAESTGASGETGAHIANPWLVTPSTLGLDHYAFTTMRPSAILEHEEVLAEEMRSRFTTEIDMAGIDTLGSFDAVHRIANAVMVMEGSFDRDALTSQLSEAGFEQGGSHREYDLYSSGESRTFAISDGQFVQASLQNTDVEVGAEAAVKGTLDAHSGATDRYQDTNDDCAQLLSALGEGDVVIGRTDEKSWQSVEHAAAEGARWRIDGKQTDVTATIVYPGADVTDESAVKAWASEGQPFGETTPNVRTDGRAVTASATVPTGDVTNFGVGWTTPSSDRRPPTASFSFSYDPQAGTVTIVHDGGDSIEASSLSVEGDGFAEREGADQTSAGTWQGSTTDDGQVAAGNEVVVGVTPDYVLELVFRGDQKATIARAKGPDA